MQYGEYMRLQNGGTRKLPAQDDSCRRVGRLARSPLQRDCSCRGHPGMLLTDDSTTSRRTIRVLRTDQ